MGDSSVGGSVNSNESGKPLDATDRYSAFIVRGIILGAGVAGIALIVRNSRVFARFTHVNQIPADFISRELQLSGRVRDVLPSGVLHIEHEPMIRLPSIWRRPRLTDKVSPLAVRLAGVDISPAGCDFLLKDLRLPGRAVTFTVMQRCDVDETVADADVTVRKSLLTHINLNVELVRRGLARVPSPSANTTHLRALQGNPAYARLISRLLMSEKIASRRGIGLWERDTWVESIRSLPSQLRPIIVNAPITKFAILVWDVCRDLVAGLLLMGRSIYEAGTVMLTYLLLFYRRLGVAIDRVSSLYQRNVKRRLN